MRFLFFFWLFIMPLFVSAQPASAGRIEDVQGDARIYDPANSMRQAKAGDSVHEGDSIVTGNDGEVHLAMEDEGQLAVRPNTRLRITQYRAEGGSSDTSIISLVQGALRSVTGWIGKYNAKAYAIRTPTATIGVRGTDHETMVIVQGGDVEPGTYDKVNHGATLLSTPHGQTEVRPNQAGFVALTGKSKPRVLPDVPAFFRPARLDDRFKNLHDKVRQQVDVKRGQRIEAIKERRQKSENQKVDRSARPDRSKNDVRQRSAEPRSQSPQERNASAEKRRQENKQKNSARLEGGQQRVENGRSGQSRKQSLNEARGLNEPGGKRNSLSSGGRAGGNDSRPGNGQRGGGRGN